MSFECRWFSRYKKQEWKDNNLKKLSIFLQNLKTRNKTTKIKRKPVKYEGGYCTHRYWRRDNIPENQESSVDWQIYEIKGYD